MFAAWQVSQTWFFFGHLDLFAGVDYQILTNAAHRWLDGGTFYYPFQLAGPYDVKTMDQLGQSPIMYPPTVLLLLIPFALAPSVLSVLWWIVPLAVTGWVIWKHQPRPIMWPILTFLAVFPTSLSAYITGNPILWLMMLTALGTLYGWPTVLVFLKPTVAPFALLGIWRRSWWVALAGLAVVSLLFAPMWPDYVVVLEHTRNDFGVLKSMNQWPMLFIPIVAWLGSLSQSPSRRSRSSFRP